MTSAGGALSLPATPAGTQAAWYFHHTTTKGCDLSAEEVAEHMSFPAPWEPEASLARFRETKATSFDITDVSAESDLELTATIDYGDGKPWKATFKVEAAAPHRITWITFVRAIREDAVVRRAEATDSAALAELERRAPVTLGSTTVTYDRGDDFLGFTRLMEDNVCILAEAGGELLGFICGATHRIRIGGKEHRAMYGHHARVPREHQGGGIYSAVNTAMFQAQSPVSYQTPYAFYTADNERGLSLDGPQDWSFGPFRASLDCATLAGPRHGRVATPDDAEEIVAVLNACHECEEMYLPYTVDFLNARLERAPDLYSWEHVLIGDGAVVGVWPQDLRVTIEQNGESTESVRAVVLDQGFVERGEDEFERLLRSWCASLVELGHTELSLLTSRGSPGYEVVSRMASRLDAFRFRMAAPEPSDAEERGLYVDAIYF